ncbi:MAG: hypothetical protein P8Y95_15160, partial [Gammaproteobacteria bacterium]
MRSRFISAVVATACLWSVAFDSHAGNGLPSGSRNGAFNLQVIAFGPGTCPAGEFTDSNRRMIAVQADFGDTDFENGTTSNQGGTLASDVLKTNTIGLAPGPDFQVIDGNACEKRGHDGAELMLPEGIYGTYKVFVRMVGKPDTGIGVTTCGTADVENTPDDPTDDVIACSTENVVELRDTGKGKVKFKDYTEELLTVCL